MRTPKHWPRFAPGEIVIYHMAIFYFERVPTHASLLGLWRGPLLQVFIALILIQFTNFALAAKVDPQLLAMVENPSAQVEVLVLMEEPSASSLHSVPHKYERKKILQFLKSSTKTNWRNIASQLKSRALSKKGTGFEMYWINNSFSVTVNRSELKELSQAPGIKKIYFNGPVSLDEPVIKQDETAESPPTLPYNLRDTHIDELSIAHPEINGTGVVIGSIDTGVDAGHPALQNKILKFYNGLEDRLSEPRDWGSHGTHTTGILVGSNQIGIAPGAKVIMAGALFNISTILKAMQFMLDPDGDPNTDDAPRVINNSWHSPDAVDQEPFYRAISAWEAAGINVVFSAGNNGDLPDAITPPKEHPATITVGGTNRQGLITELSSRGPAVYKGVAVLKPELTAPGEVIVSTLPKGKLGTKSGTSMAAPHVSATIALMLQANPLLNPAQIRGILLATTTAEQRIWNESYGNGKLNAFKAVSEALAASVPDLLFPEHLVPQILSSFKRASTSVEPELTATMRFPQQWESDNWLSSPDLF